MKIFDNLEDTELLELINSGGVGVIPTDTVYGLVCNASDENAVKKLYSLKNRENKPGTVIAGSIDQLINLGIKKRYLTAVEHFWPGALSILIPSVNLRYLHLGKNSLACRIIAEPNQLLNMLSKTGPLLTSSANQPGEPPANNIAEAKKYFGDTIDFYINGGDLSSKLPSTLIRIVDDAIEILREGAVKINEEGRIL